MGEKERQKTARKRKKGKIQQTERGRHVHVNNVLVFSTETHSHVQHITGASMSYDCLGFLDQGPASVTLASHKDIMAYWV